MQNTASMGDTTLPKPLDSETQALLRTFLGPILETASSWRDLSAKLGQKGYSLAFRQGRLVILDEDGSPLCTGRNLGTPLQSLAQRLGRPRLRLDRSGLSGSLNA